MIHADAPSSIMRFIASDSEVVRHVCGMVFKIVVLPIQLSFQPGNCVVHMPTSFIIALCHFDLLQLISYKSQRLPPSACHLQPLHEDVHLFPYPVLDWDQWLDQVL